MRMLAVISKHKVIWQMNMLNSGWWCECVNKLQHFATHRTSVTCRGYWTLKEALPAWKKSVEMLDIYQHTGQESLDLHTLLRLCYNGKLTHSRSTDRAVECIETVCGTCRWLGMKRGLSPETVGAEWKGCVQKVLVANRACRFKA